MNSKEQSLYMGGLLLLVLILNLDVFGVSSPWQHLASPADVQALNTAMVREEMPWFDQHQALGYPVVARGQVGAFYPPRFFFSTLLANRYLEPFLILLHLLLAAFFTHYLFYATGLRRTAALYGAAAVMLGGGFSGAWLSVEALQCLSFYPLALFLIHRLAQQRRLNWALGLGGVWGMQLLSGHFMYAVYSILFGLVYYALVRRYALRREELEGERESLGVRERYAKWWLPCLALLLGIGIGAAQLIYQAQWSAVSNLLLLGSRYAMGDSWNPLSLVNFWLPTLEPLFAGQGLYWGALGIFFFFCALSARQKTSMTYVHPLLCIIVLVMAVGRFSPLYRLFIWVSGFNDFRGANQVMFFASFSGIWLSAMGFQRVFDEGVFERRFTVRASNMYFWVTGFVLLSALAVMGLFRIGREAVYELCLRVAEAQASEVGTQAAANVEGRLNAWFALMEKTFSWHNGWFLYGVFSVLCLSFIVFKVKKRPVKGWVYTGLILITVIDLCVWRGFWQAERVARDAKRHGHEHGLKKLPKSHRGAVSSRVCYLRGLGDAPLNLGATVNSLNSYRPQQVLLFRELFSPLGIVGDEYGRQELATQKTIDAYRALLNFSNVGYFLASHELTMPALTLCEKSKTGDGRNYWLYYNDAKLPRVQLVPHYQVVNSGEAQKELLSTGAVDLTKEVLLFDPVSKVKDLPEVATDAMAIAIENESCAVRDYTPQRVTIQVRSRQAGVLTLADQYYPGWTAQVDGVSVPVLRANYCFRAVWVPAGIHEVVFQYEPGIEALSYVSGIFGR